jgi:FliI/YscN family ATPase
MSESALAQFVRAAGRRIRHDCAAVAEGTLTRVVGMMLGRVIDGSGQPLDGLGPIRAGGEGRLMGTSINPLLRHPIEEPLDVGRARDQRLLTIGRGQRVGLFAGSGVGKSVLLGMMARYTSADVIVVGLIGERGREVKRVRRGILGEDRHRAVPWSWSRPPTTPPLMRLHGAWLATAIAEWFRDQGRDVLLLMDSLTRFAQAQREIGLAVGEPPATAATRPRCSRACRELVERAGNGEEGRGSITAFYTVLDRGRRPAGPDCRRRACDPRRPHRAVADASPSPDTTRRSTSRPRSRAPCRRSRHRRTGRWRRSSRSCTRASSRTAT